MTSLYDELDLPKDASADQIKRAHRKGAMKHHPDRGGKPEKFHAIQKAYEVLGDPARRKRYDETGEGDQAPDLRQMALDRLAQLLIGAIDHFPEIEAVDIVGEMRQLIHKAKTADLATIAAQKRQIVQRERALKRLRFKGGGANYFAQMIEASIAEKRGNVVSGERQMELHEEALKLLADYEYEVQQGTNHSAVFAQLASMGGTTRSW